MNTAITFKSGLSASDITELKARVVQKNAEVASGGDPLNLLKRKTKGLPEDIRLQEIRKEIKGRERRSGLGGTGLTIGKFRHPAISRLIANGRIGMVELQAINEIDRVYNHLCSGLLVRGYELRERVDTSHGARSVTPPWFLDAYDRRYKPWSADWSMRKKKFNDRTLEIVFDVLFSDMSGQKIDTANSWKHGTGTEIFINGVRDYAAAAGWCDNSIATKWKHDARKVFPMKVNRAA